MSAWADRASGPRLRLLGVFRAVADDRILTFPTSARRLLAYLALNEVADRDRIATDLWPELPAARAHSDLRTALWRLRRTHPSFVEVDAHALALGEDVIVDVHRVREWAAHVLGLDVTPLPDARSEPPRTAGAPLLPAWDDAWLEPHRTAVHMLQLQAFEMLAAKLLVAGRVAEALPHALRVVQVDPLRESAQALLVEIHLRQGNVADALRQYGTYRDLLHAELGIAPGLRVSSLIDQVMSRDVAPGSRTARPQRLRDTAR
ncbi:SARP family transcriptional regulator [Cellulomonas sp. JZ18]|uniref:AfsR/SARP family transcriptional regulator n=1 Tax=Cellulomonas sp. JZ18 TaxID=2654191 RepID=UPI0012D3BB02|nr:BTAD domain-containing putative transcriptional regulator [Cellulomonas sp. JZ18]QGQ20707.1 SARP family transcriptional regulator [Cellulomonas sp. JZ18]